MRTTIDLPDPLFRRIKAKAALEGTSLKRLITRYVERGLEMRDTDTPASKPARSPIPLIRPATGKPLPALSNADIHAILDQQDAEHARRS